MRPHTVPVRMPTPPPPDLSPAMRASAPEFRPGSFWISGQAVVPATLVWLGGIPDEILDYLDGLPCARDAWYRFQ